MSLPIGVHARHDTLNDNEDIFVGWLLTEELKNPSFIELIPIHLSLFMISKLTKKSKHITLADILGAKSLFRSLPLGEKTLNAVSTMVDNILVILIIGEGRNPLSLHRLLNFNLDFSGRGSEHNSTAGDDSRHRISCSLSDLGRGLSRGLSDLALSWGLSWGLSVCLRGLGKKRLLLSFDGAVIHFGYTLLSRGFQGAEGVEYDI